MKITFRKSFTKDLKKLRGTHVLKQVKIAIERLEAAESLESLPNLKKLKGGDAFYRLRIGDYRIGLVVKDSGVDVVRCLHRRDIYKHFP